MKINCLYYGLLVAFISCVNQKKDIKTINADIDIISNEILAARPAFLNVSNEYLLFQDILSTDSIIQVFNTKNGLKIGSMGHIGDGPDEFITPLSVNIINNNLFIYDTNTSQRAILSADSLGTGKNNLIKLPPSPEKGIRSLKLSDDEYLYIAPTEKTLFKTVNESNNKTTYWGELPIKDITLSEEGKKNAFDGSLYYDPQNCYILYYQHAVPQLFLYKKDGENYKLVAKKTIVEAEYNVVDGFVKDIKLKNFLRVKDFCFCKDYIVLLDDSYMPIEKRKSFNSPKITRRQVIVLDYDLNDVKVIDLGMNTHTIGGNSKSNNLYFIAENPDYCIAKTNLD